MKVQPINNFVIIKFDPADTQVGGLLLPASAGDERFSIPKRSGTVKAVGRGFITADGTLVPPQTYPGARIIAVENPKYVNNIMYEGEECVVFQDETNIVGIITEED